MSDPELSCHPSSTLPAPMSDPPSMVPSDATYEEWCALWTAYRTLGPTARKVLQRIAERLVMGRKQYNDDFEKPRDWTEEALFEALDMSVYSCVGLIRSGKL